MKRLMLLASFAILLAAGVYIGLRFFQPYQLHGSVLSDPKLEGDIFLRSGGWSCALERLPGQVHAAVFRVHPLPGYLPDLPGEDESRPRAAPSRSRRSRCRCCLSRWTPGAIPRRPRTITRGSSLPPSPARQGRRWRSPSSPNSLGVTYKIGAPAADGSYTVEHSSYIYVIDRQGYLVMNWGHDTQPDEIASDLGYLLEHGIPLSAQLLAGPTQTPVVCGLTLIPAHVQGGEWLYGHHCAQCHGANLEGNPAWETELADGSHLPPPLNSEGTIWRHSEADLIELIKSGRNLDKAIHMPAFKGVLSDWEIHFILQYAASKWDVNQRNYAAGFLTLTPQPTPQPTWTPRSLLPSSVTPTAIP